MQIKAAVTLILPALLCAVTHFIKHKDATCIEEQPYKAFSSVFKSFASEIIFVLVLH